MYVQLTLINSTCDKRSMLLLLLLRTTSLTALQVSPVPFFTRRIQYRIYNLNVSYLIPRFVTTSTNPSNSRIVRQDATPDKLDMENIYQEWTLNQDKILWEHRFESTVSLAVRLGRGLRGIEQRLAKLRTIESPAYNRLFAGKNPKAISLDDADEINTKKKLPPSSEVLRRIQWDEALVSSDFSVVHYDRVDDTLVETPVDAPNRSISGKATKFIDALPEHRIVAIKYKERTIWDRATRMDCFFSGEGITEIIRTYNDWKKEKEENEENDRQRREYVSRRMQLVLGPERFTEHEALWTKLEARIAKDAKLSIKIESEKYVKSSLDLFKQIWSDPDISLMPQWIPASDIESLELISEFVVLYPDSNLRNSILNEISICMLKAEGKFKDPSARGRTLPELNEKELTETFTRGTGPGGQKINKTSIRVCLVHDPTQLRVECQDTRSLQQNRKIARKRLRQKLDEYLNGSQSKANVEAQRASMKKSRAKARSRARVRERQNSGNADSENSSGDSDDDWM
jgi:peptide chain release factor